VDVAKKAGGLYWAPKQRQERELGEVWRIIRIRIVDLLLMGKFEDLYSLISNHAPQFDAWVQCFRHPV